MLVATTVVRTVHWSCMTVEDERWADELNESCTGQQCPLSLNLDRIGNVKASPRASYSDNTLYHTS